MTPSVFDAYREAGDIFIDTFGICSGGGSEKRVGRFISETGSRDEVVLTTKFGFNGPASPLTENQRGGGNPNACGAGAENIHHALDASLSRMGIYVDLYRMHMSDGVMRVEELVATLALIVAFSARSQCRSNTRSSRAMWRPSMSRLRATPT